MLLCEQMFKEGDYRFREWVDKYNRYIDKGFICTLYIDEDLVFDIKNFHRRYKIYNKVKNTLNF